MIIIQYALFGLLFCLEVAGLIAFFYWGFHLDRGLFFKFLFGVGTPVLVAIFWGLYLAPKASYPVTDPMFSILQIMVFSLAAAALHFSGKSILGVTFLITVLLTKFFIFVLEFSRGI
ncbi:YrdB family protein [Oceanobacillus chungangensis]|uniref:YrdB family protein n=1 Tax=Oceanobacillus chungangensis TaxID=1229152 RepID=UPI001473B2AE|nr:YrdB family protein [Oceanobacillus chungangensis]